MRYKDLKFQEISDEQTQAAVTFDCGYMGQIIFDRTEGVHEAKLYDHKGSMVDSGEGLDIAGVEQFISDSQDLVNEFKEIMNDAYAEAA